MKRTAEYFEELRQQGRRNVAIELFSHEDILVTMLAQRPIAVLRLLAVNKALSGVLSERPEFFFQLLDHIVRHERREPNYCFFVWEFHRGDLRHLMRSVLNDANESTSARFNTLLGLLRLDVRVALDDSPVPSPVLANKDAFKNKPFAMGSMFPGRGHDIVHSADREQIYTAYCEVMQLQVSETLAWNRLLPFVASEELRAKLCRIYTYFYPYSLGPFALLDKRRLRFQRILLALVHRDKLNGNDNWFYSMSMPGSPTYVQRGIQEHEALKRLMLSFPRAQWPSSVPSNKAIERAEASIASQIEALYDGAKFDDDDTLRMEKLRMRLQPVPTYDKETDESYPGERARALLRKPLPPAGRLIDEKRYRDKLRARNADPAVARRTLINELRYLDGTRGTEHVLQEYGHCVQCSVETQWIGAEASVFLCEQCHMGARPRNNGADDARDDHWRVLSKLDHKLDLSLYAGTWYELAHYPSWFQKAEDYNTSALYEPQRDGTVRVTNTTYAHGKRQQSVGSGRVLGPWSLRVDFPMPEQQRLAKSGKFGPPPSVSMDKNAPNYIVQCLWVDAASGQYRATVVTDSIAHSLWILCREAHPSRAHMDALVQYVAAHYDSKRLIFTKHTTGDDTDDQ